MIQIKRIYDPKEPGDGQRLLVDRLWPRGLKKEAAGLDGWIRDVAPSNSLRKWFGHDPALWDVFYQRYVAELDARPQVWQSILDSARRGNITLLYSARDTEHNNAVVLKAYLEKFLKP